MILVSELKSRFIRDDIQLANYDQEKLEILKILYLWISSSRTLKFLQNLKFSRALFSFVITSRNHFPPFFIGSNFTRRFPLKL